MELPTFLRDLDPRIYLREDYICADFETTNIEKGSALEDSNRVILGSFYDGKRSKIVTASAGTDVFQGAVERIQRRAFLVAHNAKFELQWLRRLGVTPGTVLVADTMLAEYCIRGNVRGPLDLDSLLESYGIPGKESIVATWIKEGVDPCLIPVRRLRAYCETDVLRTLELWNRQRKILLQRGLLAVFFTRCLTTVVLSAIEIPGMSLDKGAVESEYRDTLNKSRTLLTELSEITGGINPKSYVQVGEFLYDKLGFREIEDRAGQPIRTDNGGRKTDEATVSQLRATTDEQRRFVTAFRSYIPIKKRLENLNKLHNCIRSSGVEAGPGRQGPEEQAVLYFNFNQAVTTTHRLSSNGRKYKVQGQNIDRDFKRLFQARRPGWKMGEADAKQLEFRVAADLSRCPQALEDIRNNVDVHLNTARVLYPGRDISKTMRTESKPFTFRPLFGGTGGDPAIRRYCRWFQDHYKGIYREQSKWVARVGISKELALRTGLSFFWPDIQVRPDGSYSNKTEIFNYPIQNFAFEIVAVALIWAWYLMRQEGMKSFIVNMVHDSIVAEVHPDEENKWKEIIKYSFTGAVHRYFETVYGYRFAVPLGVAFNLADHWGTGMDEEYETLPVYEKGN